MSNFEKGSTYMEVLTSLVIILLVLNPLFSGLIFLRKNMNKIRDYNELENEVEKVRAFYNRNNRNREYTSKNNNLKVEIKKKNLYEDVYKIEIKIYKENLKRESVLYVYEQK